MDIAKGKLGCLADDMLGVWAKTKGWISAACNSLRMRSLSVESSSEDTESAWAIIGITFARLDSRRRYSISTGLIPIDGQYLSIASHYCSTYGGVSDKAPNLPGNHRSHQAD